MQTPMPGALSRYARRGFIAGAFVGLLVGVLTAGPNFYYWAASQSSLVVLGSALVGAAVGRLIVGLAMAFMFEGVDGEEVFQESRPLATGLPGNLSSEANEQFTTLEGE